PCRVSVLGHRDWGWPSRDTGGAWSTGAIPAAGCFLHCCRCDFSNAVRNLHRVAGLEPELARRPALLWLQQSHRIVSRHLLLERAGQHDLLHGRGAWRICGRVWAGAVAERRDTSAEILSRRFPAAHDAQSCRRELDDRQVTDGIPLWPGRYTGALSAVG